MSDGADATPPRQGYVLHHLHGESTLESSRALLRAARSIVESAVADPASRLDLTLALCEALNNVVMHAYPGQAPGKVAITVGLDRPRRLRLETADWGVGFPPGPIEVRNPPPLAETGRGLFIMSSLAQRFEVRRGGDASVRVVMEFDIPPGHWGGDDAA